MESRIVIDIMNNGTPFLYIDFKESDDLRDKVLARFLYENGAGKLDAEGQLVNPQPLQLHTLWLDQSTGRLQCMIEPVEKA